MGKNKIIKKQWKRIERLEKELADRCKDIKNLIENPEGLGSIEAKFNYNTRKQFDNFNLVAGRQPDLNKTGDGLYDHLASKEVKMFKVTNDNVVHEGQAYGVFVGVSSGEEHKFPKEELESIEYKLSNYAPINVVDDKKFYGVKDGESTEKNYLSEKEMLFDLPAGVEGWRSFIINGILVHAPDDKRPEDWTKFIETLKNLPVCTLEKKDKPNDFVVEKDVKLGENYVGDVKFQKSELLDKSWLEVKKEAAKKVVEQLAKQMDVNKDGATGYTPVYSPEHLEAKKALFDSNNVNKDGEVTIKIIDDYTEAEKLTKEQIEKYDDFFKSHVGHAIEAGTHKAPDQWVLVKVKEGSIIIPPGSEIPTMVKGMPRQNIVRVGDLKKRADAMEKCTDQECKPIKQEYEKTLENVTKIYAFIGLREKNSISKGNKDIIFMKTNNYNGGVGYFNTKKPNLMYSPSDMLSDWKNNYVKPLD